MPLDANVRKRLERALTVVDDHGTTGPRLIDDARRLTARVRKLLSLNLIADIEDADIDALELACLALQLPFRQNKVPAVGKLGRTNLKDRAEQAAEMLVGALPDGDEDLLDRATRLLLEVPQRSPAQPAVRLLADALNLEDFGVLGLFMQTIQLARQGDGVMQLVEGAEKRDQYGYWDARLKDGFHFEPVRQIARRRLEQARQVAKLLNEELADDMA